MRHIILGNLNGSGRCMITLMTQGHCIGPNIELTDNFITKALKRWHKGDIL